MDVNITAIILAAVSISGIGLLLGIGLGYAGKKFEVDADPRIGEIAALLPGTNCGGCGYAGCEAFALSVLSGEAKPSACGVNSTENTIKISQIMGIKATQRDKQTAYIKCSGNFSNSSYKYDYEGMDDCIAMVRLFEGPKCCGYGCLGGGNCARACLFGAIETKDGLAVIDKEKCTSCGLCLKKCPRNLISLRPYNIDIIVCCNSFDIGKTVKSFCEAGCIGCKICEKACKFEAISVSSNLAVIDYDKCRSCNVCTKKCPTGAILAFKTLQAKANNLI